MPKVNELKQIERVEIMQKTIITEHSSDQDEGGENHYHRREHFNGTYQRTITLPGPVKVTAMTSNYQMVY